MRKFIWLAAAATMTLSAPLFAQGHGNGGQGGRDAKKAQAGGRHGGPQGGGEKAPHDQGGARHSEAQRSRGDGAMRAQQRGPQRQAAREARPHDPERAHQIARTERPTTTTRGPDRRWAGRNELHGRPVTSARVIARPAERRFTSRVDWRRPGFNWASVRIDCPPGLAKKGNGCLPPGQARKWFAPGQRFIVAGYPWDRDIYGYYDWFGFRPYAVPVRYSSFYYDGPGYYYRNYGGNVYRVATGTDLVLGLIPLLGGGFAVGQPLPIGYNVYNVPYGYRSVYYDRPDVWYRYGDRGIYAVDPETRLVENIVALVTGDVVVGQPLPVGYDVYNVPFAYRDRYYDGDDYLYRYSDGYVYRVDPRTRMVQTAILVT